ncbi:hypothetical protein Lal_00035173 [Lupinus albus]|nr:hypothetical protein Lal_00035173 [Lupinus albus]
MIRVLCYCQEIVPLKKICRRPESEYRLQQLRTLNEAASEDQQKTAMDPANVDATKVSGGSSETTPKQQQNASIPIITFVPQTNVTPVPHMMIVDPKKAEVAINVLYGKRNMWLNLDKFS